MSRGAAANPKRLPRPRGGMGRTAWPVLALMGAVLLLTALVFGRVMGFGLLRWDDWYMVAENPRLLSPTWANLTEFWRETGTGYKELYTPLTYTVMWGLARFAGVRPGVFHAANLVVHLVNVTLVMVLALRLLPKEVAGWRRGLLVAIAGALFGLHPVQVESVAWVSSLNTLLACCFGLAAACAWVMVDGKGAGRTAARLGITAVLVVLACLCKPSAVVLPLVIAGMDYLVLRGGWVRAAMALVVLGFAVLPFALIATSIQQAADVTSPVAGRAIVALDAVGFYASHLIVPAQAMADYGRTPESVVEHWLSQPYWLCGVLVVGLAVMMWRRRPMVSATIVVFVVALLPVLGLTVFQFQIYSTVADRYLYLPLAVAIPIGVLALGELPAGVLGVGLAGLAAAMAVISSMALPAWRDTQTWADTLIRRNPQSPAGYYVLAEQGSRQGDEAEAERLYSKCLELRPRSIIYLYNLGNVLSRQQRHGEALDLYLRAMDVGARTQGVYNNAFVAAQKTGRSPELGAMLEKVMERDPGYAPAHAYYGWLLLMNGQVGEARGQFQLALDLAPGLAPAEQGMQRIEGMRQ